jgi:hypothetical protein
MKTFVIPHLSGASGRRTPAQTAILRCLLVMLFISLSAGFASAAEKGVFNVMDFGAKGDGIVNDTAAVQKAINACDLQSLTIYIMEKLP